MSWGAINFIVGALVQIAIYVIYYAISFEAAVICGIAFIIGITMNPPPRDKKE